MRYFRQDTRRPYGSLALLIPLLLLPCSRRLFLAAWSQSDLTKLRRPSFNPAIFATSQRPQRPNHTVKYSASSRSAPSSPASSSASASSNAHVQMLSTAPFLSAPFANSPASSPTSPSETAPPPPTASPPPTPPLPPDPPSRSSSLSYTTSVAPVRVSSAALPLPRSAEQLAPILRGVCNIPSFNPCVPIAECVPSVPVIGEATCICPPGYVGDGFVSGQGCTDINECATGQNDCDPRTMVCIDTPGSYRCECLPGFSMAPNGRTCLDIDECQNSALNDCDPLTMTCHNLEGTYRCVCKNPQQTMDDVTRKCRDLNECEDLGGIMNPCEQLCEDRIGGFRCSCLEGYRLAPNGVSCLDIDECLDPVLNACDPAGVISRCENVVGGYRCICNEALGFQNGPDGVACVNLDECIRDPYICGGALSCCKDLFPPQRFACTVPVDDALGHTPPLGGITAYGINAALGGSALTNWIPGFLGLDSGGTVAFPRGFWKGDLLLPLIGSGNAAGGLARREAFQELGKDEEEVKWRKAATVSKGEGSRGGRTHLASGNLRPNLQSVEVDQIEKGMDTTTDVSLTRNNEERENRERAEVIRSIENDDRNTDTTMIGEESLKRDRISTEEMKERERKAVGMYERKKEGQQVRGQVPGEEEWEGGKTKKQTTFPAHAFLSEPGEVGVVHRRLEDGRDIEASKVDSVSADLEEKQGKDHQDSSALLEEENSEFHAAGGGTQEGKLPLRREILKEQSSDDEVQMVNAPPLYTNEIVVIAGSSSPEEIRGKLRRMVRPSGASPGFEKDATLSRRRLQLLTALKPGSPYLPGSQLGPIGGIRLGRGATCPAGFRLGGDLYREKVRTKMKNTFEYLITSNIQTNPDGSRRIVSPEEVTAGVLSNAQLVSDEATKWYNEFVKLPSAIAPALHIGTSAAMDVGRQAALQQLLNA